MNDSNLQIIVSAVDQASEAIQAISDSLDSISEAAASAAETANESLDTIGEAALAGITPSIDQINVELSSISEAAAAAAAETAAAFEASSAAIAAPVAAAAAEADASLETVGDTATTVGGKMGAAMLAGGLAMAGGVALIAPFVESIQDAATNSSALAQLQNELANQINGSSGAAAANAAQIATVEAKIQSLKATINSAAAAETEFTGTTVVVSAAHVKAAASAATANAELQKQEQLLAQLQGPSTLAGQSAATLTQQFSNLAQGATAMGVSFPDSIQAIQGFMEQTGSVKETTLAFNDALDLVASGGAANISDAATTIAGALGGRASPALKQLVPDITANVGPMQALNDIASKLGGAPAVAMVQLATQEAALSSNTEMLGAAFGKDLLPLITKLVTAVNEIIDKITAWADVHPKLASAILVVTAALGVLIFAAGGLIILSALLAFIVPMFETGGAVIAGFGIIISALASGIPFLVAAVVAMTIAFLASWTSMKNEVEPLITGIWDFIKDYFTQISDFIQIIVIGWEDAFSSAFTSIENGALTVWNLLKAFFQTTLTAISTLFTNSLGDIKSVWTDTWTDISNFVTQIWQTIVSGVKSGVNDVLTVINALIGAIDSLQINIPSIGIPGTKISTPALDIGFNIPKIPMLATGGIINAPMLAMLGESGPEAVVPLSSYSGSSAMAGAGGNQQQIVVNINGGIFPADPSTIRNIGNMLAKAINQNLRLKNYQP